jgi:IclR family acetate operon transcriptional repressor
MPGNRKQKENGKTYSAPAVDMALDVVEFLCGNGGPCGINELARRLKRPVNSVYRVLMRLADRGYVERDPVSNGYQLGAPFIAIGMKLHSRMDLRSRARRHVEQLATETGETCQIHTLKQNRMLVLDSVAPGTDFYLRVIPGSLVHVHANAFAKAMLAFLPEARVRQALADGMPALTARCITSPDDFIRELAAVRRTGLAYDREEYSTGIFCVGAPVFDARGDVVAGLGVTALASRVSGEVEHRFRGLVRECAAAVSAELGYSGPHFTAWRTPLTSAP